MHQKYRSILDTHPDLICRFDKNYTLTFVNNAFANFFASTPDTFLNKNLLEFIQGEQHDEFQLKCSELSIKSPRTEIESDRTDLHGVSTYLIWTIIAVYDEYGTLEEYQSLGRNVTHERSVERALIERNRLAEGLQAELRIMLDSIPCKIWYKDDKNTILKLNKMAANSMGGDVDSIEGKNTYDLFGDSAKAYHEDDLKVIKSGIPMKGFVERYTPNEGEPGWVQTDKIAFDHPISGETRILVVSTDITDVKEQEAALRTSNKNLSDFVSLVSHDLQTPLRHIAIFSDLLSKNYSPQIDDIGKAYVSEISNGIGNMQGLVKTFLKFMSAAPNELDFDTFDLTQTLRQVSETYEQTLDTFHGFIILPRKSIVVRGNEVLLRQVIVNLIENSIKFRARNRPLKITIKASSKRGIWEIKVTDNGVGVDAETAKTIFDLFGRSKPHADKHGFGVGLAICKRIITLHGGDITLKSQQDIGSEFTFSLNASNAKL